MNSYNNIPIDIVNNILEFKFGKCEKCNEYYHFDKVIKNCRIINYKSVFDDSYWVDEIIDNFFLICKGCIKSYPGKHIIDTGNNTYKWINDY